MTEAKWQVLAELTRDKGFDPDLQMVAELIAAVRDFGLPVALLERVQRILEEAIHKALKTRDTQIIKRAITLRVKAKPNAIEKQTQANWGFFCIEKETASDRHAIEVFLYQEGADR